MKYFTDQSLKNEISGDSLDLGKVDAPSTKQFSLWVLNDYGTLIEHLKFSLLKIKIENGKEVVTNEPHPEMKIVKAPEIMPMDDRQEIIFTWSPEISLKEKTQVSLDMKGKELW